MPDTSSSRAQPPAPARLTVEFARARFPEKCDGFVQLVVNAPSAPPVEGFDEVMRALVEAQDPKAVRAIYLELGGQETRSGWRPLAGEQLRQLVLRLPERAKVTT